MGLLRKKNDNLLAVLGRELSDLLARRNVLEGKLAEANGALRGALHREGLGQNPYGVPCN